MSIGLFILLASFVLLVLIDAPIAVALGLSSVVYLLISDLAPLMIVAQRMVAGIDSFTLLAIPLFLLAGTLMVQGGLAPRIVAFCAAIVGRGTGGLAIVMIAACMMFGSLSGSGVADVVAIGSMMLPAMKERGYHPGFSSAALGCAGSLGTVIPPSIVLIVYGTATNTSIGQLFVGAIVPGVLLGLGLMIVAWWISRRNGWKGGEAFSWSVLGRTFVRAIPALIAPLIIVGGIRSGIFTPTEAAGIGVFYALLIGAFLYRSLTLRGIAGLLRDTAEMTGAILFVIATASVFGWILAAEQVPQMAVNAILALTDNATLALLLILAVVLVLGTFIEIAGDHPDPGAGLLAHADGLWHQSGLFRHPFDHQSCHRREYAAAWHRPDGRLPDRRDPDVGILPLSAALHRRHGTGHVPAGAVPAGHHIGDRRVLTRLSLPISNSRLT